jgi:hypothetical protein
VVLHAAQARRGLIATFAGLATAVAGCGGGSNERPEAKTPTSAPQTRVIHKDLGVDVRLANCMDWLRGDDAARRGTIQEISGFAGSQVGSTPGNPNGPTISETDAYALFQRWCAQDFAKHFKLYKLYTRAAAFTPRQ